MNVKIFHKICLLMSRALVDVWRVLVVHLFIHGAVVGTYCITVHVRRHFTSFAVVLQTSASGSNCYVEMLRLMIFL